MKHTYKKFEKTKRWKDLLKGIRDLKRNNDIDIHTPESYVVGYLCMSLSSPKRNNKQENKKIKK